MAITEEFLKATRRCAEAFTKGALRIHDVRRLGDSAKSPESRTFGEPIVRQYLLIASRDARESSSALGYLELARDLSRTGAVVSLFLVQNGVFAARRGARPPGLEQLVGTGVHVLADDYSLKERGILGARLSPDVKAAPIDVVIEALANGTKVLWD